MNKFEKTKKKLIEPGLLDHLNQSCRQEGQTIIHCRYVSKSMYINGGWVNIHPTTYLRNRSTGACLQLEYSEYIPVAPAKYYFSNSGELKNFTLYFPAVPDHWTEFDFVEQSGTEEGFVFRNISRNKTGVYSIQLH